MIAFYLITRKVSKMFVQMAFCFFCKFLFCVIFFCECTILFEKDCFFEKIIFAQFDPETYR